MSRERDSTAGRRGMFFRAGAEVRLPVFEKKPEWVGPNGPLGLFTVRMGKDSLASYRAQSHRVTEDANGEQFAVHGGVPPVDSCTSSSRTVPDALLESQHGRSILVRLTKDFLYCADDGAPISEDGIVSLMFSRISSKRNKSAIGRFGIGFKSVLGVTDTPEFYSRPRILPIRQEAR